MARIYQKKEPAPILVIQHRLPKTMEEHGIEDSAPFNVWFAEMFPEAVKVYGPGFLEGRYEDVDGFTRYYPAALNEDAWAAALAGRRDLGLQVVWFPPEAQWYFWDYRAGDGGAFCLCSTEKLGVLLSNYLMRCADAMNRLVDIEPFVTKFRLLESLLAVVNKAKVILEADAGFFSGKNGQRRIIQGKVVESNALPGYVQFVKKAIVREPTAKLTVADAFHRYYEFCKESGEPPLTRADFKELVGEVIRENFNLGIRHDVKDDRGKSQHGWVGLDCSLGRN